MSTRARSGSRPISKNSHTSTEGPGQGIALDPTGPWQGFTPEPRGQRQGMAVYLSNNPEEVARVWRASGARDLIIS